MTIKQSADGGDELVQETMADRLKKVQSEGWRKLRYSHDESADSWAKSEEVLYMNGAAAAADDDTSKGKEAADGAAAHERAGLVEAVSALGTGWREETMLETTSGIKSHESVVKVEISDDDVPAAAPAAAAAPTKAKAKAKAKATTAAAAAATASTRGKRATTATSTTDTKKKETTTKAGPSTRAKKSKS